MKIAFVFSGQGAQKIGMGKELYDNFESVRKVFEESSEVLGFSAADLCFSENDRLNKTSFAQPAILTLSMACFGLIKEIVPGFDYAAGLSLGEYTALTAAGCFDFKDAVRLVRKRGLFMEETVPDNFGGMSAVMNLSAETVEKICEEVSADNEEFVRPANYNMPGQIVISGELNKLKQAEEKCKELGAKKVIRLNTAAPFHTKYLEKAAKLLEEELNKIEIKKPLVSVVTNVYAKPVEDIKNTLVSQTISPVKWEQSVKYMIKNGVDTFVELGPGKTLINFIKKTDKNVNVYNIEDMKSYEKTISALSERN